MSTWNGMDLTLPEVPVSRSARSDRPLALTILYHPEIRRIGEVALLESLAQTGTEPISRLQPRFAGPASVEGPQPLQDGYLSRSPVSLSRRGSRLMFDLQGAGRSFYINGQRAPDNCEIDDKEIAAGIVLSLAHRVVLLLHEAPREAAAADRCGLIGESDAVQSIRRLALRVAQAETPVLLLGESGTGKELVAQAIHSRSTRSGRPMLSVNMAAVPEDLAVAELFGARRGAFTGADRDRPGYFQRAAGGTLFLDEIGACSAAVQAQLLRALQQGEMQVPGGETELVDTRVIAATDAELTADGQGFSKALRHRLGGFEIHLPPLRDRREDLGRLLLHFLPEDLLAAGAGDPRQVSQWVNLIGRMAHYHWPGNVRELSNYCGQIAISSADGTALRVPTNVDGALLRRPAGGSSAMEYSRLTEPPSDTQVKDAMLSARWEVSEAARRLKISRQALYRRIESIPELRVAADIPAPEVESAYHESQGDVDEAALRLQVSRAALRRRLRAMDLITRDC